MQIPYLKIKKNGFEAKTVLQTLDDFIVYNFLSKNFCIYMFVSELS